MPKRLVSADSADAALAAAASCSSVAAVVAAPPVRLPRAELITEVAAELAAEVIADVAADVAVETAEPARAETSRFEIEPRVLSTEGVLPVVTRLADPVISP